MAKVLVSMPDEFLSKIDDVAQVEQRTRSELIREALRSYLKKNKPVNVEMNQKRAEFLENLLD